MLTLSKEVDYGLLLLYYLDDKKLTSLSQLIKKTKLPRRFLARIAGQLVKNKIIESKEGKRGGYKLGVNITEVTFYDYLKSFKKKLFFSRCLDKNYRCQWEKLCYHRFFFQVTLSKKMTSFFKQFKIKDLFNNFKK